MSDATYEARVITLPVDRATTAARGRPPLRLPGRWHRVGTWSVDDWGRDPKLVDVAVRLGQLRWNTLVGGVERLPARRARSSSSTPGATRCHRSSRRWR